MYLIKHAKKISNSDMEECVPMCIEKTGLIRRYLLGPPNFLSLGVRSGIDRQNIEKRKRSTYVTSVTLFGRHTLCDGDT